MLVRALSRKCGVKIEPQTESAARVRRPGLEVGTDCFRGLSRFTRLARGFAVGGGTPYRFAMGSDVGAIWASLKAKTAPSQHAARAKALLRDARGDSSSQSTTREDRRRDASGTRPSYEHSVTGARGPEATDVHHPEREASDTSRRVETRDVETERVSPSRASSDPPDEDVEDGSGTTFEDRSAMVATEDALRRLTARDLNVLADTQSAPQTRVRASRHVREVLETRVEPALLAATAAELFLKPFLRRLEDASERCRESAADALTVLVRGIAACPEEDERGAVLDLLPYAVPVLRDRLGPVDEAPLSASDVLAGEPNASASASRARTDPREPSEEIRVKLHRVFRELLVNASQSSGNSLAAYASDAVLVLQFTAEDAFWEVAHEACVLLEALCDELGRRLSPAAKKLAWTFAPNLTHRRSKVRVATLRALRALMHCGAHETILDLCAFKHPNLVPIKAFYGEDRKVNYFGKLALDSCAPVRLAFVETLGDWMTTLVERADHEPRLLPYVMSAAADEATAVRDAAAALLAALGAQYEREHEKDLKATVTYAPEHFGVDDFENGDPSDPGDEEPRVLFYPPPFAARPGLGARVLVKNNFPAVVNPILAEMMGWQEDARVRASKLLRANLVFLEENATQHCQQLCLAFVKVCASTRRAAASTSSKPRLGATSDSGASRAADVEPTVAQCCALVGAFVKPDEWLEVLLERCGPGNEPATVAGALAVAAECCAGAAAEDMLRETDASGVSCPCDRILDVLEHPSLVGSSDTAARSSVCRFAETVLSRRPRTWGGGGRCPRGNRRLARLLGAALRAGAGDETESPGDEAAEPARACRAAFAAAARALGTRSANACFDETRAQNEMMARLRGELLAPLAALPRGAWRARDAAALTAICGSGDAASGGVAFDAEDASTAIRLVALVAEARASPLGGATSFAKRFPLAALLRFPFLETLEHSPRDEDVATVFSTTLSALTSTLARTSIDADAIAIASSALRATTVALRREACSDAAARAAAGAVAARVVAVLESLQDDTSARETPGFLRARVCALAGTLANRVIVASKTQTRTQTKEPSVLAAPRVLARLVPALGARLDDADAATRDAAAAALAALAAAAPLAAYHCVRVATAAHFVEEGARADARRGSAAILAAAHAAHPSAAAAAVARPEGGGAAARAARVALAAEAGVSALGAFADADAALEGGLLPYARSREARDSDLRVAPGEATEEARRRDAPTALFGLD